MKFGVRRPSLKKRVAARTSVKRAVRHRAGLKAPRGMGWITNPKKAAYNRVYRRTTFGCITLPVVGMVLVILALIVSGCSSGDGTPRPTRTPAPSATPEPTNTPAPTATSTLTPLPTNTRRPTAIPTTCACTEDIYNCSDFPTYAAQVCYKHCLEVAGSDVHRLDRDSDGNACEWK